MRNDTSMVAFLDDFGKMTVLVSHRFYNGKVNSFYLTDNHGYCRDCMIKNIGDKAGYTSYDCVIPADISLGKAYYVNNNYGHACPLEIRHIVNTETFDNLYSYHHDDLGAKYTPEATKFAIWAPTAINVMLEIEKNGQVSIHQLHRTDHGVYRLSINEDLKNATYVYYVEVNGQVNQTVDPYALSSTANGKRSAIIDLNDLEVVDYQLEPTKNYTDAIIYECSVKDMTSNQNSNTKTHGLYCSLCEENTKYDAQPTGYDYLKSLGITHVQLMPVFDFATVDEMNTHKMYNWGYDPLQFMVPEGSYSTAPNEPIKRMQELKKLINALHLANLKVTLDIVINHVYDVQLHAFHQIVPYYYFRYNKENNLSNGTFCGNELASDKIMVRKYIIDNMKMWTNIYDVDGLRFDLMGILDIATMNLVYQECRKLKDDFMVYGEGWYLPTCLSDDKKAMISNHQKMPNIAHFNDFFRDNVKGASSDDAACKRGYLTGDYGLIYNMMSCLAGSCKYDGVMMFTNPTQSINYVECHDNQTSWDKMKDCCKEDTREVRIKKQKLMLFAVLVAQGIPFIHAGQEFARTKLGLHNTYNNSAEINSMDYSRMVRYAEIVNFFKQAVSLRKKYPHFRMTTIEDVNQKISFERLSNDALLYKIQDSTTLYVYINPTAEVVTHHLNKEVNKIFDETGFIEDNSSYEEIKLAPYSCAVYQGE